MKATLSKIVIAAAALALGFFPLLAGIAYLAGTRADVAHQPSGAQIRQIEPGMSLEQVISILGRPYEIAALNGLHNSNCTAPSPRWELTPDHINNIRSFFDSAFADPHACCSGNREDKRHKGLTLVYTRPVFAWRYPMLWVHLDSNYLVESIYARAYNSLLGKDETSFYNVYEQPDTPGKVVTGIDEATFSACFP